jgi:hypothetical protein
MCCVYDGLEPYNHYEPQQDANNPNLASDKLTVPKNDISTWDL